MLLPILIVIGVIVIGAIFLVYIGVRNPQSVDDRALMTRLEELNMRGEEVNLE